MLSAKGKTISGLSAPAGVPKELVDVLATAIKKAIANEDHLKKMEEQRLTVRYMDPTRMEKYWSEMEEQIKPLMGMAKEK